MAAVPIPNGYAEVAVQFQRTGMTQPAVMTMGIKLKASPTPATVEADFKAAWTAAGSLNAAQPPTIPAQWVRYRAKWGGVDLSGQQAASWAAGGGAGGNYAPQNLAWCIRKQTGIAGRKYRGRMFLPWVGELDVDAAGAMLPATVTAYNAALAIFRTALGAAGRTCFDGMVLLHRDGSTPTPVVSLQMRNTIATVRHRQPT